MVRNVLAAAGLVVLGLVVFAVLSGGGGDDRDDEGAAPTTTAGPATTTTVAPHPTEVADRPGSTVLAERGDVLAVAAAPASFEIRYEVSDGEGAGSDRTETLQVRRPFESRLVTELGSGGQQVQTAVFGALRNRSDDRDPSVLGLVPALAVSDLRPEPVVAALVADGVLVPRERREVLGAECQVYRGGSLLFGGDAAPYDPEAASFAEACLDARGLLLEELLYLGGEPVLRRLATAVAIDPPLDDPDFEVTEELTLPATEGGGETRPLAADAQPPGAFLEPAGPPAGFEPAGRFSVVYPAATAGEQAANDPDRRASIVDVWGRGPDAVLLERGGTLSGGAPFTDHALAVEVEVDDPGFEVERAELVRSLRGLELRLTRPGGQFVRIHGPVGEAVLREVLAGLTEVEGSGELTPAG